LQLSGTNWYAGAALTLKALATEDEMPAKLTVIVYILICFEVGVLLLILPWTPYWDDNFFLYFITGKLQAQWLGEVLQSGYMRGAVNGLGILNIGAGLWEIYKFRESVRSFSSWETPSDDKTELPASETAAPPAAPLPDHRSPNAAPSSSETRGAG
jgi:hypothetical protein